MAKADKALSARRVQEIYAIRLDGARWVDVVQFVRENESKQDSAWYVEPGGKPLSDGMIRKYQEKADALLMQSDEKSRRKSFRRHLAQRKHIYSKAVLSGDYRAALAALRDEAEMLGLYPARKTAGATPLEKPQDTSPEAMLPKLLAVLEKGLQRSEQAAEEADGPVPRVLLEQEAAEAEAKARLQASLDIGEKKACNGSGDYK
jgi:hypothetical protein